MHHIHRIIFLLFISALVSPLSAQVGITVSPGRVYYKIPPGGRNTQKVSVTNPNSHDLEIGVSVADWEYDSLGNNITHPAGTLKTSCSGWLQVLPGSYFTLRAGQQQNLDLLLSVPPDADTSVPVHTAMLYITQLNPSKAKGSNGAAINVTVRMGIKIYHSFHSESSRDLEITNFSDQKVNKDSNAVRCLDLLLSNTGKIWIEGSIKWELLNEQTGEKTKLDPLEFYSLPGDKRIVRKTLPLSLKKGRYNATAIVSYGNKDELKLAELEFDY